MGTSLMNGAHVVQVKDGNFPTPATAWTILSPFLFAPICPVWGVRMPNVVKDVSAARRVGSGGS
jgi:hypothetical protein